MAHRVFTALAQNSPALFQECLGEPSAVTARLADGRTALMMAAALGQVEQLDALLTAGADVSAEDIVRTPPP